MGTSFSLRYFLKIVFDYFWFIAVTLILINGTVIAYNIFAREQYIASTRIYVERAAENSSLVQKDRPFATPPSIEQVLSSEGEITTSHPVVFDALSKLNGAPPRDEDVAQVIARLQVVPLKKSNVLRIDYRSHDAKGAAQLLNVLVESYRSFRTRMVASDAPDRSMQERLNRLRFQIDSLYQAQQQLLTQYKIADFDNTMRFLSQSIFELESNQNQLDGNLADVRRQIQYYESELASFKADPRHVIVVPENWVMALAMMRELQSAQDQLSVVLQTYTPSSNQAQDASSRVNLLQQQVVSVVGSHLTDLKQKAQSLEARQRMQGARVSEQRGELLSIPEVKSRSQSIESALESMNRLYTDLVRQQMSEDVTSGARSDVSISLLSPAVTPTQHTYPRRGQNVLLGLLGSLVLTISLVYILESLDATMKNSIDFEKLGIPFLASFTKSE